MKPEYNVILNTVQREGESQGTSRLLVRPQPPPSPTTSHRRTQACQHTFHPRSRMYLWGIPRHCYNLADADAHERRRWSVQTTTGSLENGIHKKQQMVWHILTFTTNCNEVTSVHQHFVHGRLDTYWPSPLFTLDTSWRPGYSIGLVAKFCAKPNRLNSKPEEYWAPGRRE